MTSAVDCIHCGTPFHPEKADAKFCCAGCEVVYDLLFDEGLDRFYELKGDKKVRPARERPFQPVETEWIESLIAEAESADEDYPTATVHISGTTCVGCVWLIETLFHRLDGAVSASVDPSIAEGTFSWKKGSDALLEFARELPRYGYSMDSMSSDRAPAKESRKLLARLGICAAFALNTMAFSLPRYLGMDDGFEFAGIFDLVALVSSTLALFIGGSWFFVKAIGAIQQKTIHIDLPIALGLALAFIGSCIGWLAGKSELFFFDFVAIFTTLMLAGRYIHLLAIEQVSHRLQGQSALIPEISLADGSRKATTDLKDGDRFELPPGRALPVVAQLESDDTEFSLAWMTGEPDPRLFPTGRTVPAGAIVLANQAVQLTAREDFGESAVSKLYESARKGNATITPTRFLKGYLISIIFIGIFGGLFRFFIGHTALDALQVTISIFVISCPCAIGVAIPLVERRIGSAMARQGVFVQQSKFWQNLIRVKNVILDKTGTLTLEHPELRNRGDLENLSAEQREVLAILTTDSIHPLDRTLREHIACFSKQYRKSDISPGLGRSVEIGGHLWTLGKPGWRGNREPEVHTSTGLSCEFACDGKSLAIFEFGESLRPEAVAASRSLMDHFNLQLHILSGDSHERILQFAEKLGIPAKNAFGSLSPEQKLEKTEKLQPALYLGDGMNDAPSFAASTVTGTPVTDRSMLDRNAGFIFTCEGLSFLPRLFEAARWTRHTTILIIAFTIVYNVLAITACLFGKMTPLLASILMPVSSIISIGIAMRPVEIFRSRVASRFP